MTTSSLHLKLRSPVCRRVCALVKFCKSCRAGRLRYAGSHALSARLRAVAPGCWAGMGYSVMDQVTTAAREYNEDVRWGRYDKAAKHVPKDVRAALHRQAHAASRRMLGDRRLRDDQHRGRQEEATRRRRASSTPGRSRPAASSRRPRPSRSGRAATANGSSPARSGSRARRWCFFDEPQAGAEPSRQVGHQRARVRRSTDSSQPHIITLV